MTEIHMPRLDPGMQSGKIVEWLKKEGDQVQKGEAVLVVEGEKTTFEIEAPDSGPLTKILAPIGTDVDVGQAVGLIGGGDVGTQPSISSKETPVEKSTQIAPAPVTHTPSDRIVASPAARRLAQEYGVDISTVKGTGPGGRISREDILAAKQGSSTVTVVERSQPAILKKFKLEGIRKAVAERLSYSARTVVPVIFTMEADATKLMAMKERDGHISFTAFAVKAAAKTLEKHSNVNSTIEGDEVNTYSDVNVAVAIHTEQGLVAPVVRNANKKSVKEINAEIEELSVKAKEKSLTVENLTGGTFTISNLGAYEIESFAPTINPPQCAILGLGRIVHKPYAKGNEVAVRPSTLLTLVFDHRIVDGAPAAKFLQDLKRALEEPEGLL
jgi:pyruvate dehydrogenase E2 component (dihydrolipoamide acetyltransferase)